MEHYAVIPLQVINRQLAWLNQWLKNALNLPPKAEKEEDTEEKVQGQKS